MRGRTFIGKLIDEHLPESLHKHYRTLWWKCKIHIQSPILNAGYTIKHFLFYRDVVVGERMWTFQRFTGKPVYKGYRV